MRIAYSEWDTALEQRIRLPGGAAETVLPALAPHRGDMGQAIGVDVLAPEPGYIPEDWGIDAFLEQMEKENLVTHRRPDAAGSGC